MFNVTIEFDQVAQDDVASYRVYDGEEALGMVLRPATVDPIPFSFTKEKEGVVVCRVSAVDKSGNESVKSEELNIPLDVPPVAPNKPRLIAMVWTG